MRHIVVLLLASFVATAASAQWTYINKVDDFTDEVIKAAIWEDKDHKIQLSRIEPDKFGRRSIWMYVSRKGIGTIAPDGLIELRIDKNATKEIKPDIYRDLEKLTKMRWISWQPDTVAFFFQAESDDRENHCQHITPLILGETLRIRYRTDKMDTAAFAVPLAGQTEKLVETLELEVCVQ
jgi:hypothetical protein